MKVDPHLVTDVEIHFVTAGADTLYLTIDAAKGDESIDSPNGQRIYRVCLPGGLDDVHIIAPECVRYCRLTQRYTETPSPVYAGDGVTVIGELPVPGLARQSAHHAHQQPDRTHPESDL